MGMNRTFKTAVAALMLAVGSAGLVVRPSFAGVFFICTGTKGHAIRAAGKSFIPRLRAPMPTMDGSLNEATASIYTATCRDGKKTTP